MRYDLGRFRRPMRRSTEGQLASLVGLGDGSTLSLDFTAMSSLDSRFTFTRASTATYINSSGLVTTMAAASTNDPTKARFDHDPTTLAPRGLLIEGSATNLVLQSDTLPTTNWAANAVTRTNVSTVTPDGNTTATTCGLSHTGAGSFRSNPITVTASTAYTFSFWAKNNGGSVALYRAYNVSGSADIVAETSYFSQINGSTWTRVQFTFTTPVGCTSVYVYPLSQSSGTSNVLIWGAQLEAGSGASSYIATGASTVQRAADDCRIDNVATSFGFNSNEGTILIQYGGRINTGSNRSYTFIPASGGSDQIFEGSGIAFNVFTSGSFVAQIGATSFIAAKVASAYKANDFATSVNGGAVAADTAGAVPTTITRVSIGGSAVNAAAYNNGPIIAFKYWPTRLPDATLRSLTA